MIILKYNGDKQMNSIFKYMRYFLAFLLLSLFASTTVQASSVYSSEVNLHLDGTITKIRGTDNNRTCDVNDQYLLGTLDESSTGEKISLILTVEEVLNDSSELPLNDHPN